MQNAITYNEPGGTVYVRVGPDPALVVRDTGQYVRSDEVPGSSSRSGGSAGTTPAKGAGLGLSIVRSIAHAHDGS